MQSATKMPVDGTSGGRTESRLEDDALLVGKGRYFGDNHFDREVVIVVLRSSVACAVLMLREKGADLIHGGQLTSSLSA